MEEEQKGVGEEQEVSYVSTLNSHLGFCTKINMAFLKWESAEAVRLALQLGLQQARPHPGIHTIATYGGRGPGLSGAC